MTLQELQDQALKLSIGDRWQLVQAILESLKREAKLTPKKGNLSRLRGIAKKSAEAEEADVSHDYVTYLTEKHR